MKTDIADWLSQFSLVDVLKPLVVFNFIFDLSGNLWESSLHIRCRSIATEFGGIKYVNLSVYGHQICCSSSGSGTSNFFLQYMYMKNIFSFTTFIKIKIKTMASR